jgi:uncharacterized protein YbjT (DUF2867 family)
MKIIVTGSLGNVSKPLTEVLLQLGHQVTVISHSSDKQGVVAALGATAAIGSVTDADFLTNIFAGADAVYCMVPPHFTAPDNRAYYRSVGAAYAQAIQATGVSRVVYLSTWGADLPSGTGLIVGSHDIEGMLNQLPAVSVSHLRAGYIYYNLLHYQGMIKEAGFMGATFGGDDLLPLVAPIDIAAAAADELTRASGPQVRYVASDERTPTEVARVLGKAIGRPDLQWRTFTPEQGYAGLAQQQMPAPVIAQLLELNAAIHNGSMWQGYAQHRPAMLGEVKLENFAQEFAAAFQQ